MRRREPGIALLHAQLLVDAGLDELELGLDGAQRTRVRPDAVVGEDLDVGLVQGLDLLLLGLRSEIALGVFLPVSLGRHRECREKGGDGGKRETLEGRWEGLKRGSDLND